MKKLYYLLFIIALVLGSACVFSSCGDDEERDIESSVDSSKLIGTWQVVDPVEDDIHYIVIKKGGDLYEVSIYYDEEEATVIKGKWNLTSKGLTVRHTSSTDEYGLILGNIDFEIDIIDLTNSRFVYKSPLMSVIREAKKVSDSVADKYIKNAIFL